MEDKNAYQERIEAQIEEWGAKLNELKAKTKGSIADQKVASENRQRIIDTEDRINTLKHKLIDLKRTSGHKWEDIKDEIDEQLDKLRNRF